MFVLDGLEISITSHYVNFDDHIVWKFYVIELVLLVCHLEEVISGFLISIKLLVVQVLVFVVEGVVLEF